MCFHDTTEITKDRIATFPLKQVAVQMYAAMCNMGMSMQQLANMRNPDHAFQFLKTAFSCTTQDGRQTPYKSDFVLHSVTPVSKAVAVANLQPIPGQIEYAPGCPACFYRCHTLDTGKKVYCRYNLMMSEDIRQVCTGIDTHSQMAEDDCETQSSLQIAFNKGLTILRSKCSQQLMSMGFDNRKGQFATAKQIMQSGRLQPEKLGVCPQLFAGVAKQDRELFAAGIIATMQHLHKNPDVFFITGNAYAPSAGGGTNAESQQQQPMQKSVCGHCYCGMEAEMVDIGASMRNGMHVVKTAKTILESTKWVNTTSAYRGAAGRNNNVNPQITKLQNQVSTLMGEITKVTGVDPRDDLICSRLEICPDKEGDENAFYALGYVYGNKSMFTKLVPGAQSSSLVFGVDVAQYMNGDSNLLFAPKQAEYELLTLHVNKALGKEHIKSGEVKKKLLSLGRATAIPEWSEEVWQRNVFDTYVPCSCLYEDPDALQHISMGVCEDGYCPIVFSHECSKQRIHLSSEVDGFSEATSTQKYVQTILSVLRDGEVPPITEVHAQRILDVPPYKVS